MTLKIKEVDYLVDGFLTHWWIFLQILFSIFEIWQTDIWYIHMSVQQSSVMQQFSERVK